MSQKKYIGMDVHQATLSVAVMDSKLIMVCILTPGMGRWRLRRWLSSAEVRPIE